MFECNLEPAVLVRRHDDQAGAATRGSGTAGGLSEPGEETMRA